MIIVLSTLNFGGGIDADAVTQSFIRSDISRAVLGEFNHRFVGFENSIDDIYDRLGVDFG